MGDHYGGTEHRCNWEQNRDIPHFLSVAQWEPASTSGEEGQRKRPQGKMNCAGVESETGGLVAAYVSYQQEGRKQQRCGGPR